MGNLTYTTEQIQAKLNNISLLPLFKAACLLGDSITGQHLLHSYDLPVFGSQGFWNWANWLSGHPFHFVQQLGVSGDTATSIFARIWQIYPHVDTVFILAGTNDIYGFSSSSNQSQIDTEIDRLIGASGVFTIGLQKLKEMQVNVCIGTIIPNNAFNTPTDARIQVLDAVNAWIMECKSTGRASEVVDLFTAMWDSSQPTLRIFKTNYSYDGTHLNNSAGQAGGLAGAEALRSMYVKSNSALIKHDRHSNIISLIGQMRTIAGVTSNMTYGAGSLASGWRSLNTGTGSPTLVLSNADDFVNEQNYVGPMKRITASGEKWQKCTITNAVAGSKIQLRLATDASLRAGDEIFAAMDIHVESSSNLKNISLLNYAYVTAGTSPIDQPHSGTANNVSQTNNPSTTGTEQVYPETSFRTMLFTEPFRVPENISGVTVTSQLFLEIGFGGNGGAVVKFSRAQLWKRI